MARPRFDLWMDETMITGLFLFLLLQAAKAPNPPVAPDVSTKAGVEAEAKAFFSALDANKDGKVERAESVAFHTKAVTLSERLRREAGATFSRLDDNKDGMLSRDEYMSIAGTPPPPKEVWFDGNDADKNGRVEMSEVVKRVQITFDALDTNKDGKLSTQEKAAARGAPTAKP